MAKNIAQVKLQVTAGQQPAPPIGPALGQHGINIMDFVSSLMNKPDQTGIIFPVIITIYADRTFSFITNPILC